MGKMDRGAPFSIKFDIYYCFHYRFLPHDLEAFGDGACYGDPENLSAGIPRTREEIKRIVGTKRELLTAFAA